MMDMESMLVRRGAANIRAGIDMMRSHSEQGLGREGIKSWHTRKKQRVEKFAIRTVKRRKLLLRYEGNT